MTDLAIHCENVSKRYPHFHLNNINLTVPTGAVMGFVGPNGAGKSTTMRIIMGLINHDQGDVTVLGHPMPQAQIAAKRDIGFISEEMRLYSWQSIGFHMDFIKSIYPDWDDDYAEQLVKKFGLVKAQKTRGLSHGQRVKTLLMLTLARRPKLLILDEPTTGLDPVARHEFLKEMMSVIEDESRSILFSSHNTLDIEQISDHITFINHGEIVDSRDKESFLDSWKRIRLEVNEQFEAPALPGIVDVTRSGHLAVITTGNFNDETKARLEANGGAIQAIERMTLEEIFLASVTATQEKAA